MECKLSAQQVRRMMRMILVFEKLVAVSRRMEMVCVAAAHELTISYHFSELVE